MDDALVWKHIKLIDSAAREVGLDPAIVGALGLDLLFEAASTHERDDQLSAAHNENSFVRYAKAHLKRKFINYRRDNPERCEQLGDRIWNLSTGVGQKEQNGVITSRDIEELEDSVSEDELKLLRDYYVDGMTYEQIGMECGVGRQTIYERMKKVLAKVKP